MKTSFKKFISISALISLQIFHSTTAWSVEKFDFKKYVPDGTLVREKNDEFKVKTTAGTVVEIETSQDGSLDEASGNSAKSGDVFFPGMGLLSLKEATDVLEKLGKKPEGEWSLEKGFLSGWVYEIEGKDNGRNMEYKVDAKTGQLLKEEED